MSDLKFKLTITGGLDDLNDIANRLGSGGIVEQTSGQAATSAAVKEAMTLGTGAVKTSVAPLKEVVKEADPEVDPDVDVPPTNKRDQTARPGTAAALLNDPTQPGQAHLAEEQSEGLNEPEEAEEAAPEPEVMVVDPDNLTGQLYELAREMDDAGRMVTDGIQTKDKKRAKVGATVGFMYDASDPNIMCNATILKTWRGKALIVDKDGEGHIVSGKELTTEGVTATETPEPTTAKAESATDPAETAPETDEEVTVDDIRALYTEVTQIVSAHRATQIMIDTAGKKKLTAFTNAELAQAAAMLRDELKGFKAQEAAQ